MHLNSRESKLYYKNKLKSLSIAGRRYPNPVYERDGRLVRIWKGSHKRSRYWFYKRAANRFVRRTGHRMTGGQYRKVYDYWWNVD